MFSERQLVAGVLESYLGLIRSEAVVLASAMSRLELRQVIKSPQAIEPLVVIGELVPLLVRVELRAVDESDDAAVCEVIDRGQERMATATRLLSTGGTHAGRDQCAGVD